MASAPDSAWTVRATELVADVAGVEAVAWTDSRGRVRGSDTLSKATPFVALESTLRTNAQAFRTPAARAGFIAVPGDPARVLMVVPRCSTAACGDLTVAMVGANALLGAVLADTVLGFDMAIGDRHGWFRASAPPDVRDRRSLVEAPVFVNGPAWRIGVWPSVRSAAVTPSTLSDLVLLLGLCVSVLLAIGLRLAQAVSQSARLEERAEIDRACSPRPMASGSGICKAVA